MSFHQLYYHIVFSTFERRPVLKEEIQQKIYMILYSLIKNKKGNVVRINGTEDHIHILTTIHPDISIKDFMRFLKTESSKRIRAELFNNFKWDGWQEGSGYFSVSYQNVPVVKEYIMNQKEHHKTVSFIEEYRNILIEEGIDPNLPWFPK